MDEIHDKIEEALFHLPHENVEKVKETLSSLGVMDTDDLKLVTEEDLSAILKPIQVRKFLQHINKVQPLQSPKTPSHFEDSVCSDTSSEIDSPKTSRCSTPLSDMDTPPTKTDFKISSSASNPNWLTNFSIPWNKFPKPILVACSKKKRPRPSDRREMVRILCDHILQQCKLPGRKALSKIAEMVAVKYSDSFCDDVGGTVIGSGYESLRKQLEERLYNENRKPKSSGSLKDKLKAATKEDNDKGKRKNTACDSYGCINWQPDTLPENESEESQKNKQEWLIEEFSKKNGDEEEVYKLMKETYASQRLLINRSKPNSPSIAEIKENWPYLFTRDLMLQHFEQLMGFKLKEVLKESLEAKGKVIYDFLKQEQRSQKNMNESLLKIDEAMDVEKSKVPMMNGVYLLLLAYFGEPKDIMVKLFDETATEDDVTSDSSIPATPFIATFGDVLGCERCGLVIDQVMVNPSINGIGEGVMMLFASYFVLNIAYPNEIAATMEFIQRCMVNLNPDKGSKRIKTKGKHQAVNPKVLTLANALKDFQSQWVL